MKNKLQMLFIALLVIVPGTLLASEDQATRVSGIVTDAGDPLPGVNVLVKGTTIGTVTGVDGRYTLDIPSGGSVLVFSFIGYLTEEVVVGGRTTIDVMLRQDVTTLNEVVVVGAVMKKSDLTGAVAALEGEKLVEVPTASITQAMAGRMSGVLIQSSPGVSGGASIKIRGNNSLQFGNNPIFVVDGLIMDGGLNLINPGDIASIDVLKDASATAIYGSRGANGVVIVTTKKGRKGEGRVTYDGWAGIQEFSRTMPRLGARDMFDLRIDAYANAYMDANPGANRQDHINNALLSPDFSVAFSDYEFETYNSGRSYDWLDAVTRQGQQQNHNISFSKGTDEGTYYVSFNYTRNRGLMENSTYNRYTGRVNLDQNIRSWLRVGTNTTYARSHETYVQGGVFSIANAANPLLPVNDSINYLKWAGLEMLDHYNPLRSLGIDGDGYQTRLMTSNYINVKPVDKVNIRTTFSADIMDQRDFWYTPRDIGQSIRNSTDGTASQRNDHWLNWQWDNTVTYEALSGEHNLTALAGFSLQQNKWDYNQLNATGFATDDFSYKYVSGAYLRDQFQMSSNFTTSSLMSYTGRINYSYNEKYFATVTARYDGSSRFDSGNKWGVFPSVAVGWNIAEEEFFRSLGLNFVNIAKLRAGYGIAGNQNIPNFAYKTLYYPQYTSGSVTYVSDGRLGNTTLVWEKQKQLNLGLDLVLMDNRVNLTVDYFTIDNEDLLMQRTLSYTTGFSNVISNIGALENKGIELGVVADVVKSGPFTWSVSGNISSARNKITKLYGDVPAIYNKGGFTGVEIQREGNFFLGESLNSIYVYKFDKIAQEADMDRVAGMELGGRIVRPGDVLPLDRDGNNIINDDDRYVVGSKDPKFYGGFSTDMEYRNFSLNAVFTYNYGAKRISYLYEGFMNGSGISAAHRDMLDRWTPTHTDTNVPRAYNGGGRYNLSDVDWGVQDASFLRLSALTLAYTVPLDVVSKAKMNNLRVYFTGSNLFVNTKYKGYDPEGGDDYPMSRMYVAGINIGF